ncbi:MAG: OmpA family protein [Crocinitomicaceae bacterium]|nr:OmpA family protein [Crocinitomicaceae bacterium]
MKTQILKNIFLTIIIIFCITTITNAQNSRLKYADKMYDANAYYYASEAYEDALARKTDSSVVASKIADSYDKIGNRKKAAEWYSFLNKKGLLSKEQQLRYALLERGLENYNHSNELLANYEQKYGNNDFSKNYNFSIDELKKDKGQFILRTQKVNTPSSDMSATYFDKNNVLLSSSKRTSTSTMTLLSWTGNYFYDIYKAPINDNGEIGKMKLMKAKAKTKFHDGPAVYNEKNGFVYFTRNNYLNGKKGFDEHKGIRLKIYKAKIDGTKFKDIVELSINDDNYSTAHPSVSEDGKRLYFSSDKPGGFGGMDIYYVYLDNDGNPMGSPINLGEKVNTNQHEVFPTYNSTENILFFSSEGHFGLGGLDIYLAKLNKSGDVTSIENIGSPINSPFDDFAFVNNSKQTKGYFTSNRNGGKGDDDIYGFDQNFPFKNSATLKGNAKNLLTKNNLGEVKIFLADKNGNLVDSTITNENGEFELSLTSIKGDFTIIGEKDGFIEGQKSILYNETKMEYEETVDLMPMLDYFFSGIVKDKVTHEPLNNVKVSISDLLKDTNFTDINTDNAGSFKTVNLPYKYNDKVSYEFKFEKSGYVTKTVALGDILALEQEIKVNNVLSIDLTKIEVGKTDLNDVVDIAPIYFDLNKWDIRPDAAKELNKIVAIMKENPGMVIELGSHTDSRGSKQYNITLSDKRAKSSASYIISQGIAKDRIYGKGYGANKLKISDAEIAKAKTDDEKEKLHQQNRRTEFIIIKMK